MKYVVITPVRDEELHLGRTIDSMVNQTVRPTQWIIVNDGSTDNTGTIAESASALYPWITVVHRTNRGYRKSGDGVVEAFYAGYERIKYNDWNYITKLDGDLAFNSDYFENCFLEFAREPNLGIGGGLLCSEVNGRLQTEWVGDPAFHVRGAVKMYRRKCWDDIGGLIRAPGWDSVDELAANMLGWNTKTLPELRVVHLRTTGAEHGAWRDYVKNGLANYVAGYHPIFMLAKCVKRLLERPFGVVSCALAWGYVSGYFSPAKRVQNKALIRYVRSQQVKKLLFRPSLW